MGRQMDGIVQSWYRHLYSLRMMRRMSVPKEEQIIEQLLMMMMMKNDGPGQCHHHFHSVRIEAFGVSNNASLNPPNSLSTFQANKIISQPIAPVASSSSCQESTVPTFQSTLENPSPPPPKSNMHNDEESSSSSSSTQIFFIVINAGDPLAKEIFQLISQNIFVPFLKHLRVVQFVDNSNPILYIKPQASQNYTSHPCTFEGPKEVLNQVTFLKNEIQIYQKYLAKLGITKFKIVVLYNKLISPDNLYPRHVFEINFQIPVLFYFHLLKQVQSLPNSENIQFQFLTTIRYPHVLDLPIIDGATFGKNILSKTDSGKEFSDIFSTLPSLHSLFKMYKFTKQDKKNIDIEKQNLYIDPCRNLSQKKIQDLSDNLLSFFHFQYAEVLFGSWTNQKPEFCDISFQYMLSMFYRSSITHYFKNIPGVCASSLDVTGNFEIQTPSLFFFKEPFSYFSQILLNQFFKVSKLFFNINKGLAQVVLISLIDKPLIDIPETPPLFFAKNNIFGQNNPQIPLANLFHSLNGSTLATLHESHGKNFKEICISWLNRNVSNGDMKNKKISFSFHSYHPVYFQISQNHIFNRLKHLPGTFCLGALPHFSTLFRHQSLNLFESKHDVNQSILPQRIPTNSNQSPTANVIHLLATARAYDIVAKFMSLKTAQLPKISGYEFKKPSRRIIQYSEFAFSQVLPTEYQVERFLMKTHLLKHNKNNKIPSQIPNNPHRIPHWLYYNALTIFQDLFSTPTLFQEKIKLCTANKIKEYESSFLDPEANFLVGMCYEFGHSFSQDSHIKKDSKKAIAVYQRNFDNHQHKNSRFRLALLKFSAFESHNSQHNENEALSMLIPLLPHFDTSFFLAFFYCKKFLDTNSPKSKSQFLSHTNKIANTKPPQNSHQISLWKYVCKKISLCKWICASFKPNFDEELFVSSLDHFPEAFVDLALYYKKNNRQDLYRKNICKAEKMKTVRGCYEYAKFLKESKKLKESEKYLLFAQHNNYPDAHLDLCVLYFSEEKTLLKGIHYFNKFQFDQFTDPLLFVLTVFKFSKAVFDGKVDQDQIPQLFENQLLSIKLIVQLVEDFIKKGPKANQHFKTFCEPLVYWAFNCKKKCPLAMFYFGAYLIQLPDEFSKSFPKFFQEETDPLIISKKMIQDAADSNCLLAQLYNQISKNSSNTSLFQTFQNQYQLLEWLEKVYKADYPSIGYFIGEFYEQISCFEKYSLPYYSQAADSFNNPRAQYKLGKYFINSPHQSFKGIKYLEAASKFHGPACYQLAEMYHFGNFVKKNFDLAIEFYLKSIFKDHSIEPSAIMKLKLLADHHPSALHNLCLYYLKKLVFYNSQNPKALKSIQKLIEYNAKINKYPQSQFNLGHCYHYGIGVERDFIQAYIWYTTCIPHFPSISLSHVYFTLSQLFSDVEKHGFTKSIWSTLGQNFPSLQQKKYLHLAANLNHHESQILLFSRFKDSKFLESAANAGLARAQFLYGEMLMGETPDQAEYWLLKSSKQQYNLAYLRLAQLYFRQREYHLSFEYLQKTKNDFFLIPPLFKIEIFLLFGECYLNGFGTDTNTKLACESFSQALCIDFQSHADDSYQHLRQQAKEFLEFKSLFHYPLAQFSLGKFFLSSKNLSQAQIHFQCAAKSNHIESIYQLGLLNLENNKTNQALQQFSKCVFLPLLNTFSAAAAASDSFSFANQALVSQNARNYIEQFSAKKVPLAQYYHAQLLLQKKGRDRSENLLIVQMLKTLSDENFSHAQYTLSTLFSDSIFRSTINQVFNFTPSSEHVNGIQSSNSKSQTQTHLEIQNFLCKNAAENGSSLAFLKLGQQFYQNKNYSKAFQHFQKSYLINRNKGASYCLGFCFLKGIGVNLNEKTAIKYLQHSASQNFTYALYVLGHVHKLRDSHQAVDFFYRGALQRHPPCQFELAKLLFKQKRDRIAIRVLKKSARNSRNSDAQTFLGNCYLKGLGVEKNAAKGIYHLKQACNVSNGSQVPKNYYALYFLSTCYKHGLGVSKNDTLANDYLHEANTLGLEEGFIETSEFSTFSFDLDSNFFTDFFSTPFSDILETWQVFP